MSSFRVAHVTDLHCNGKVKWQRHFDHLITALATEAPDLIAITGDCVNHPRRRLYECFSSSMKTLYTSLVSTNPNIYILAVPGNHDRFLFGNKILNMPSSLFEIYSDRIIYPNGFDNFLDLLLDLFVKKNVALFPLDSTKNQSSVAWARGRVDKPHVTLEHFAKSFQQKAEERHIDYNTCIKIAMLHHHLIPLPANFDEERLEPYNIVQNPYELLHAIAKQRIDVVLNGHRHVSDISELRMHSVDHHPVIISACGQSCAGSGTSEFKVIEFDKSGASNVRVVRADSRVKHFELFATLPLVPYEERRKRRCFETEHHYSENDAVEHITRKTKLVRILNDNTAVNRILLNGIFWRPGVPENAMSIVESAGADIGRIMLIRYVIDSNKNPNNMAKMSRSEFVRAAASTCEREKIDLELRPNKGLDRTVPAYGRIEYQLYNGYALDQAEHEDAYGDVWSEDREEASAIQARYPTETLELVVQFPSKEHFPEADHIHFDVYEHEAETDDGLINLRREYTEYLHDEEKDFLRRQHALQIFEDINQITFTVRHPQPGLIYNLRWRVPKELEENRLVGDELRKLRALRRIFDEDNSERREQFYDKLKVMLEPLISEGAILLLAADQEDEGTNTTGRLLKVVCGPEEFRDASKLCVGRGIAGNAFKMRKVDYYEKNVGLIKSMEKIKPNMDPHAILAMPLLYPGNSDAAQRKKSRAFGVISVLAADGSSEMVKRFGRGEHVSDDNRAEYLKELYEKINLAFSTSFPGA